MDCQQKYKLVPVEEDGVDLAEAMINDGTMGFDPHDSESTNRDKKFYGLGARYMWDKFQCVLSEINFNKIDNPSSELIRILKDLQPYG